MATLTPIGTLNDRGAGISDVQASLAAAVDLSNDFDNDGNLLLFIDNGSGAPITATLVAEPDPFGRGGGGDNDETITIPAGQLGLFPFASPAMFNAGGKVTFTLSDTTSVSIGTYRLVKVR